MRSIDRLLRDTPVRERTAYQMRQALCHFYLGRGSKKECLDALDGISETTYYRIKNEYPDLVDAIDRSARREALYRTCGEDIAFQARQKRESREIQRRAAEILKECLPVLASIALGEPRRVDVDGETQFILVYPRDRLKAIALVQKIAREGTLPKREITLKDIQWAEPPREAEEPSLDWLINIGVPTDFHTVTATTPDGREVKATVVPPSDPDIRRN
jgi:hypothetical protein